MTSRIQFLLTEFASKRTLQLSDSSDGQSVLVTARGCVVDVIDDVHRDELRALAHVGDLRPAESPDVSSGSWVSSTNRVDDFEWSVACHPDSGMVAVTSAIERSADADEFEAWLAHFVEQAEVTAAVLSDTPLHTLP
jgi:hypothetical protein